MAGHDGFDRDDEDYEGNDYVRDADGEPLAYETEELALADEDERLPWLESGDDEEAPGVDTARIVGFALIGLVAIALLVGGIWWATNRTPDSELVADGSTIEAPEGPYKERPDDPGGRRFEGTGDVAPGVGEGEVREGRLAEDNAPRPSVNARRSDEPAPEPSATASAIASAAPSGGPSVQVGAYSTRASAEEGWRRLQRQTDKLNGVGYRIEQGTADFGTVFRLKANAGSAEAARNLCNALKSDGVACQVKD